MAKVTPFLTTMLTRSRVILNRPVGVRPKGRHGRRSRIRRLLAGTTRTVAVLTCMVMALVAFRDTSVATVSAPTVAAPSLKELNASIASAEDYLDPLFKQLDNGTAVFSETSDLDLRALLQPAGGTPQWVLLGQGTSASCFSSCTTDTTITPEGGSSHSEQYLIGFKNYLTVDVTAEWAASPTTYSITVRPVHATGPAQLWLGTVELGQFSPNDTTTVVKSFPKSNLSLLHSLRYTVRHSTQEGYLYELARGHVNDANEIAAFLQQNGYTPGFDLRAAIFGKSNNLPDDLPFNTLAYPDCNHLPAESPLAYPYQSKACLVLSGYLDAGAHDSFLQATQALVTVQKYGPDHSYPNTGFIAQLWDQGTTPTETSNHLQMLWAETGFGVPSCTPLNCSDIASGIRTSAFGALETILGYSYGNVRAQQFADAAAAMTIRSQIGRDGIVHLGNTALYRPIQAGAFPVAWNAQGQFVAPSDPTLLGGPLMLVVGKMSMPNEYLGVQASNAETSLDGWAFLVRYRCAKYGVGCGVI